LHEQGSTRLEGGTRNYLAKIELHAGNLDAAEREARAAAELFMTAPPVRPAALAVLARVLLAKGRADDALAAAREAYSQLEELGSLEEGEATVRLTHAEALMANGLNTEAGQVLVTARDQLLQRAAKISDATWRERFLNQVPDNARTLALAPSEPPPALPESGETGQKEAHLATA
jgi:tetratricopeptide (TPR) repeat protein